MTSRVLPFWFPPSLLTKQLASTVSFAALCRWRRFPRWLLRYGPRVLPVAGGAVGMGCIGFPNHPVWEVTSRCNLSCRHCHVASSARGIECDHETARRTIAGLAGIREFRMLVYTGGEPLVREDIFELLAYSRDRGFINVVASNATLVDEGVARRLKKSGVAGLAVSLDSCFPAVHDEVRQSQEAFERALAGIQAAQRQGIVIQANITAMSYNADHIDRVLRFADALGVQIGLLYQLVPVGRGAEISDQRLRKESNRELLSVLARTQRGLTALFEPVASPQYWPYLCEVSGTSGWRRRIACAGFYGCTAGRGLLYIRADGEMLPCPFLQVSAGNAYREDVVRVWRDGDVFVALRDRRNLKGDCGVCRYRDWCGGCRGKAYAVGGDFLAEDPDCFVKDMFARP